MGDPKNVLGAAFAGQGQPAIRFLVENALRRVKRTREADAPRSRDDWVAHLAEALMSDSETSHTAVLAALRATGVSQDEIIRYYIPSAARHLGELWVSDKASFVDVTLGSGRLQALLREECEGAELRWLDRSVPLGQSILMVVPDFEHHSLGAFAAADLFRRHGLWVHMGIGLKPDEISDEIGSGRFAMVGLSAATWATVEQIGEVVESLRSRLNSVPPVVVGGRIVTETGKIEQRTGCDFAVRSVREAIEKCGLSSVGPEFRSRELI